MLSQNNKVLNALAENKALNFSSTLDTLNEVYESNLPIWTQGRFINLNNAQFINLIHKNEQAVDDFSKEEVVPLIARSALIALFALELNTPSKLADFIPNARASNSIQEFSLNYIPTDKLDHITVFSAVRRLLAQADDMIFNGCDNESLYIVIQRIFVCCVCALSNSNNTDSV